MTKSVRENYGIHRSDNGLWFLLQQSSEQNSRGLNVKSNFKITPYRGAKCPHDYQLVFDGLSSSDDRGLLSQWESDPLGQLLLPNPDNAGKIAFVDQTGISLDDFTKATELVSPVKPPVVFAWMMTLSEAKLQSSLTNVMPFIILDVTPKWMAQEGKKYVDLFRMGKRPLILVGDSDAVLGPDINRVSSTILKELSETEMPLRELGAKFLRDWMRNAK